MSEPKETNVAEIEFTSFTDDGVTLAFDFPTLSTVDVFMDVSDSASFQATLIREDVIALRDKLSEWLGDGGCNCVDTGTLTARVVAEALGVADEGERDKLASAVAEGLRRSHSAPYVVTSQATQARALWAPSSFGGSDDMQSAERIKKGKGSGEDR